MFVLVLWTVPLIAAVSLVGFTARRASERGRTGARWAMLSVTAGLFGQIGGMVLLNLTVNTYYATDSIGGLLGSFLASLFGPLGCMVGVLWLLTILPERVPIVDGTSWLVHRMPSGATEGSDCVLSVDNGRLHIGDQPSIEAKDITEIVVDGECLRVSWLGQSALLWPAGKSRTPFERAKHSLGLAERLRALLRS